MTQEMPSSVKFPEIPQERIRKVFIGMTAAILAGGEDLMMKWYGYRIEDNPSISRFVDRWAERWDVDGARQFKQGANFVHVALSGSMPKVNRHTVKTFESEFNSYFDQLVTVSGLVEADFNDEAAEPLVIAEKLAKAESLVNSDFKLSEALEIYATENQALFEFLRTRSALFMLGGYSIYELKRRQFLNNQLKRTMGKI